MEKVLTFSFDGEFEELALQAMRDGENGAEWGILERLVSVVLSGKNVDPVFQSVVNAIVAKAVICGKLPHKRRGRPVLVLDGADGNGVAHRYLELTDGGMKYADAVGQVAAEFPKKNGNRMDDRSIMLLVAENRPWIERQMGVTAKARQIFREEQKKHADVVLSTTETACVTRVMADTEALQAKLEAHAANDSHDWRTKLDRLIAEALTLKQSR